MDNSIISYISESESEQNIPVHIGNRPVKQFNISTLPHVRQTIRRDNKILQAVSMPKMSCYNMRSLMPKIENLAQDIEDRNCSISLLTEVWEKLKIRSTNIKLKNSLK